ncbi:TetR/AcrR family transcriptional regulator [Microbacterium karelineae]|uniref:TetR/AcrR family transcriptional regulator n=1 Tax=Microbacterium karelineae TaxID=2654283 RepID=UPI0012EA697F|nr:TetR family transcriptional regulator [Microbacterium karelineae]
MNTRSPLSDDPTADPDPIVLAAVHRFAREGFSAPLRQVAADAGVSAALIMKRFASKDGLRAACDDYVLAWIRRVKAENMQAAANGQLLASLATTDEYAPLLVYVMHSVMEGGQLGRDFVEHMIADAEVYTAEAVARGVVRPSRDEKARVRFLVMSGLGTFLLSLLLRPVDDTSDLAAVSRRLQEDTTLPMLELYTEGMLTSRTVLDEYLAHREDES